MISMELLGERVRIEMAKRRYNQRDLCKRGGFGKALVNDIYNGRARHTMSIATLEKLAEALGVSVIDLIDEQNHTDSSVAKSDTLAGKCYTKSLKDGSPRISPKLCEGVLFHDHDDRMQGFDPLGIKRAQAERVSGAHAKMRGKT